MFEHPYLSQRTTELELEQLERALARRRFIKEHADQVVLRPEGVLRRAIRRMVGRAPRATAAPVSATTGTAPDVASRRVASDSASASASASRRAAAPCEPAAAR
ncbi:hypothetical protein [Microbacterium sp. LWH12-1.2]|uniref:hypothetical protein n=1 Tax=Microbacterium sp. LWH12-1.2 TaxID=3135259 RepID=UPI003421C88B